MARKCRDSRLGLKQAQKVKKGNGQTQSRDNQLQQDHKEADQTNLRAPP
jgi:hypothetical protein